MSVLVDVLRDPNFIFPWLLEEASGTFGLPSAWSIKNHRQLFEEIYRQAYGIWKNDLDAVRFVVPALNELGIDTGDWEETKNTFEVRMKTEEVFISQKLP
ncbi:hypothetical protein H8L32_07475 [Undibacterium sp. CY18W]|uniref:Uncharacterized protein n=1 Tax=Undibacterium hunanense TaxID=2762292 RepID=A0ABR6ZP95_9BURK|nr:hypothetical protein [Undibacterium hunanense]MBC3917310.1 hypothetical protein [Undibacterium hunanense]